MASYLPSWGVSLQGQPVRVALSTSHLQLTARGAERGAEISLSAELVEFFLQSQTIHIPGAHVCVCVCVRVEGGRAACVYI